MACVSCGARERVGRAWVAPGGDIVDITVGVCVHEFAFFGEVGAVGGLVSGSMTQLESDVPDGVVLCQYLSRKYSLALHCHIDRIMENASGRAPLPVIRFYLPWNGRLQLPHGACYPLCHFPGAEIMQ